MENHEWEKKPEKLNTEIKHIPKESINKINTTHTSGIIVTIKAMF